MRAWLASDAAREPNCGYLCWIESVAASPDESPEQVAAPRLLPCNTGVEFTGRVRETVLPSLERLGLALKCSDFHRQPVGPRGLELSDHLRAADGRAVRIVGYMVAVACIGWRCSHLT